MENFSRNFTALERVHASSNPMKEGLMIFALAAIMLASNLHANAAPVITGISGPGTARATIGASWSISAQDPEGQALDYFIDWGDGKRGSIYSGNGGVDLSHEYAEPGVYALFVSVADPFGLASSKTVNITVVPAPDRRCVNDTSYSRIGIGSHLPSGNYSLRLDSPYAIDDGAAYTVFYGKNAIGNVSASAYNTAYFTAQNGDLLRIDSCQSRISFTSSADYSIVKFSVAKAGGEAAFGLISVSGPEKICAGCDGYWQPYAYEPSGEQVECNFSWGDGSYSANGTTEGLFLFRHSYQLPGNYSILVTARSPKGEVSQKQLEIAVTDQYGGLPCQGYQPLMKVWHGNATAGNYTLAIDSIVPIPSSGEMVAYYTLFYGQSAIGELSLPEHSIAYFTAQNGDRLRVETCKNLWSMQRDSGRSFVKFSLEGQDALKARLFQAAPQPRQPQNAASGQASQAMLPIPQGVPAAQPAQEAEKQPDFIVSFLDELWQDLVSLFQ